MKNKRGWIRILEVTIAVLIVSATMLAVYSQQLRESGVTEADYVYSLQGQILADIVEDPSLRFEVLRVIEDFPKDISYDKLDRFVEERIPSNFGYLLRVCNLGDTNDYCKMDARTFVETMDNNVYTREVVVSSDLGNSTGSQFYSPKKVKLFVWEGGFSSDYCRDECVYTGGGSDITCLSDLANLTHFKCISDHDTDECFEYEVTSVDACGDGKLCDIETSTCKDVSGIMVECGINDGFLDLTNPPGNCADGNSMEITETSWCTDECSGTTNLKIGDCLVGRVNCDCSGGCDTSGTCSELTGEGETYMTTCQATMPTCNSGYHHIRALSCVSI